MAPKKTKYVTLKLNREQLEQFPDLTAHFYDKKRKQTLNEEPIKRLKLKLNPAASETPVTPSEPVSRESSMKPSDSVISTNTSQNVNNLAKLSSNIRVGVSGLSMNPSIFREIDKSKNKPGQWEKYGKEDVPEEVQSMKDVRGYKEHPLKAGLVDTISKAHQEGRRVVRSFSGYLMIWPSWHKVKEGNLVKHAEYATEKPTSKAGGKGGKGATSSKTSVGPESSSLEKEASETPVELKSDV